MTAPASVPRFFDLLRALSEHGVEFVVIGGLAVSLHGYVRATKDLDVVPRPTADNAQRLWEALATIDARPVELADLAPTEMPVPFERDTIFDGDWALRTSLGRLDLMPFVEDVDGELPFEELRAAAERVDLEEVGHPVWVASLEHVIGMKQRADRDQDRIDITALRMAHGLEAE